VDGRHQQENDRADDVDLLHGIHQNLALPDTKCRADAHVHVTDKRKYTQMEHMGCGQWIAKNKLCHTHTPLYMKQNVP
jgi:hypothetical protein